MWLIVAAIAAALVGDESIQGLKRLSSTNENVWAGWSPEFVVSLTPKQLPPFFTDAKFIEYWWWAHLHSPVKTSSRADQIHISPWMRESAYRSPDTAIALDTKGGPTDIGRLAASQDPMAAAEYARMVDSGSHPVTRAAVSSSPEATIKYMSFVSEPFPELIEIVFEHGSPQKVSFMMRGISSVMRFDEKKRLETWDHIKPIDLPQETWDRARVYASEDPKEAFLWAKMLDKGPHPVTRAGASKAPHSAYEYAYEVDREPYPETRIGASAEASLAFNYAYSVDRRPHDITRAGAVKSPQSALQYAIDIDKRPRDDTRLTASMEPSAAVTYAKEVDGGFHPVTWNAVKGFIRQWRSGEEPYDLGTWNLRFVQTWKELLALYRNAHKSIPGRTDPREYEKWLIPVNLKRDRESIPQKHKDLREKYRLRYGNRLREISDISFDEIDYFSALVDEVRKIADAHDIPRQNFTIGLSHSRMEDAALVYTNDRVFLQPGSDFRQGVHNLKGTVRIPLESSLWDVILTRTLEEMLDMPGTRYRYKKWVESRKPGNEVSVEDLLFRLDMIEDPGIPF